MDKINIERGAPLPKPARVGCEKYPWTRMKVGDSFFTTTRRGSMSGAIYLAQLKTGFKFSGRSEPGGTRVWRIA